MQTFLSSKPNVFNIVVTIEEIIFQDFAVIAKK